MLLDKSLLVLDAAAREYLEETAVAFDRSFHKFHPHSNYEKAYEVDRGNQDQEQDAPHSSRTQHECIPLAGLVVQSKVDDRNLDVQGCLFERVKFFIIKWRFLNLGDQTEDQNYYSRE